MTKKQLRIAMVCDPINDSKSGTAGAIVSALRFSKLLEERGHYVIFVGARSGEQKNIDYCNGIKTYRYRSISLPKSGGWHLAFPTVGELKKVFAEEKIDIVHIILPMSGAIMAIKAARALNLKIVAHSHSQPENIFMNVPKIIRPALSHLWNKYLAWVYGKAELLIYPSEMARSLLQKLGRVGQPSAVISNGINLKEFYPTEIGDFYERFKIPKDKVKLIYVGRLHPEKSLETLIQAIPYIIKESKDVQAMLTGSGHQRPKLEKLVQDLNVSEYVTFLGFVSDEDKLLAYNAGDIFVLPSLAELEGMVVLEAMACGKPIIVADAKMSASRFFVSENGFLFKARDPKDLAEKALRLVTNPDLREKMGQVSLEKVKNYDIERSAERLEEAYYRVLQGREK